MTRLRIDTILLFRYHRMTLAAAKVVVAEEMKVQGSSSSRLSMLFMKEIQQIQHIFGDKTYWKNQEVKVYLHRMKNGESVRLFFELLMEMIFYF